MLPLYLHEPIPLCSKNQPNDAKLGVMNFHLTWGAKTAVSSSGGHFA